MKNINWTILIWLPGFSWVRQHFIWKAKKSLSKAQRLQFFKKKRDKSNGIEKCDKSLKKYANLWLNSFQKIFRGNILGFKVSLVEISGIWGFFIRKFSEIKNCNHWLQKSAGQKSILILTKCKDPLEWEFYMLHVSKFGWTKDVLKDKWLKAEFEEQLKEEARLNALILENLKKVKMAWAEVTWLKMKEFRLCYH